MAGGVDSGGRLAWPRYDLSQGRIRRRRRRTAMTPLDEAPEQRWRRTVDRRNRPAKLKVDRLLRDFGYAELDASVGDAIEARLAGVSLAVAPSLREASANEVVTIYANDAAVSEEPAPAADDADAAPAEPAASAADVGQMV